MDHNPNCVYKSRITAWACFDSDVDFAHKLAFKQSTLADDHFGKLDVDQAIISYEPAKLLAYLAMGQPRSRPCHKWQSVEELLLPVSTVILHWKKPVVQKKRGAKAATKPAAKQAAPLGPLVSRKRRAVADPEARVADKLKQ